MKQKAVFIKNQNSYANFGRHFQPAEIIAGLDSRDQ